MCAILEAKVHNSDTGSMLASISHVRMPPFRIENRSLTHYLRFVQEDSEAVVFELPPMYSCAYTWDSPTDKKKLRAVVIPETESKQYLLNGLLKQERKDNCNETEDTTDSDSDSTTDETTEENLMHCLSKSNGLQLDSRARELNKTSRYRSPRKRAVFGVDSRSFNLSSVGKKNHVSEPCLFVCIALQVSLHEPIFSRLCCGIIFHRQLPCPTAPESESGASTMTSKLFTHTRVVAGTKILSFSDSAWLSETVQTGILKKGGNFKSACCEMNGEGVGFYIMNDFPREVMAVVVRDIQLLKPTGSIEMTARARHFQVGGRD